MGLSRKQQKPKGQRAGQGTNAQAQAIAQAKDVEHGGVQVPGPTLKAFVEGVDAAYIAEGPGGIACTLVRAVAGDLVIDLVLPANYAPDVAAKIAGASQPAPEQTEQRTEGGVILPDGTPGTDPANLASTIDTLKGQTS